MVDVLRELAAVEGLSPKDTILARTLVRRGLAPPERVLDAARAAAADPAGSGILARLTASGDMTEERARGIRHALEKRLAERKTTSAGAPVAASGEEIEEAEEVEAVEDADEIEAAGASGDAAAVSADGQAAGDAGPAAAAGTRAARVKRGSRRWTPRPRGAAAAEGERKLTGIQAVEARARREKQERQTVDAFVERFVRSRLHELIMNDLARIKAGIADPKGLARRHGAKEKAVRRVLEEWKKLGLLKTVSTFPYYYDPPPAEKEAAELFRKAWRDPARHNELLKRILASEG